MDGLEGMREARRALMRDMPYVTTAHACDQARRSLAGETVTREQGLALAREGKLQRLVVRLVAPRGRLGLDLPTSPLWPAPGRVACRPQG